MWRWKRSRDSLCSRSLSSRIARVPEPFSRWMRVSDRRSSTETTGTKISPEEIKRVKGLGCLKDKRYDDIFNIRVLTRNGRITTEEHRAIADAAEKFGNREITMTTCQYGLIDTFSLSKKIHERFYLGYHNVTLPHKFKIAVGGCPNNCVKPNLNDLGIIGQRIPKPDTEKCRGCKVCQIAKNCPVKVPEVIDGKIYINLHR